MLEQIVWIVVSLGLLFAGAEGLVRGSSSLALRAGVSPLLVGLTIVAFGTSSPELVVSLKSSLAGQGDIAVGNVIGSNSFNIAVILGLTALLHPVPVHRQILRIDAPVALGVTLVLVPVLMDGAVSRFEGVLLSLGIIAYTTMNIVLSRREAVAEAGQDTDSEVGKPTAHWALDLALVAGGLAVLVYGSNLLVNNSVALAQALGVSEAVIGLTIVAAGTSMPELATSVVAALRRQPDIAVGNVIGSNVFNVLAILGVASVVAPIEAPGVSSVDLYVMIGFTVLLMPLLYLRQRLHRAEGMLLLIGYIAYVAFMWPKS